MFKKMTFLIIICVSLILSGCGKFKKAADETSYFYPDFTPDSKVCAMRVLESGYTRGNTREVIGTSTGIVVVTEDGGTETQLVAEPASVYYQIASENQVIAGSNGEDIQFWDYQTGDALHSVTTVSRNYGFDLDTTGTKLAAIENLEADTYCIRKYTDLDAAEPTMTTLNTQVTSDLVCWENGNKIIFIIDQKIARMDEDGSNVATGDIIIKGPVAFDSTDSNYVFAKVGQAIKRINITDFSIDDTYAGFDLSDASAAAISHDGTKALLTWKQNTGWGLYIRELTGTTTRLK